MYTIFNTKTGKFSNSWNESHNDKYSTGMPDQEHLKLIRYETMNDPNFTINEDVSQK